MGKHGIEILNLRLAYRYRADEGRYQEDQDVDRQSDGHRDGESGEKDVFKFRLHGMAALS